MENLHSDNTKEKDEPEERGRNTPIRLPAIAAVEHAQLPKPEKLEPAVRIDEAFANLAIPKPELPRTEEDDDEEEAEDHERSDTAPSELAADVQAPEHVAEASPTVAEIIKVPDYDETADITIDDAAEAATYTPEPLREIPPDAFGADVIVNLNRDEQVPMQTIPLHAEATPEAPFETADDEPEVIPPLTPVYTPQLEQQHQAFIEDEPSGEAPEPAAAGNGGETPPPEPPDGPAAPFEQPPELPEEPLIVPTPPTANLYPLQVPPYVEAGHNAAGPTGAEELVTKKDAEKAAYYAARAGQNRGLVTGLLVGGAYEHLKHRRREKKQEKRFKQQGKQLKQAEQNFAFGTQEHAQQQAEASRHLASAEQRFATSEQYVATLPSQERPIDMPAVVGNRLPSHETSTEAIAPTANRLPNPQTPEKLTDPNRPQLVADTQEQLVVPADHRLETSAWHSIEIDAKTGKPVENPTFAYGHEYYRERAQENTPIAQRNAAAGEVALVAAAAAGATAGAATDSSSDASQSTSPSIPNASTQGAPAKSPKEKAQSALKSMTKSDTNTGPLWPWLVALFVIAVCLIAVVH